MREHISVFNIVKEVYLLSGVSDIEAIRILIFIVKGVYL